jgi:hypothetical protein
MEKKYKPVVFSNCQHAFHRNNILQQHILLKGMAITQDPKELKKLIGVNTVAEVYRTLDKLGIRKEYHDALGKNNVSLDYVVKGLKTLADNGTDKIKLSALQTLLKSLGLDKYEDSDGEGKNWEEILISAQEQERGGEILQLDISDYEVVAPVVPESVQQRKREEEEIGRDLYA